MSSRGRRFLEHMSDVYVEAYGRTLEEAFEEAGLALFDVISDTRLVRQELSVDVEADGFDKESLLYNWLERLLLLFELDGFLASRIEVQSIEGTDGGFVMKARVYGEKFDPRRHKHGIGVKSVTYALMEIEEGELKRLRFVLDI